MSAAKLPTVAELPLPDLLSHAAEEFARLAIIPQDDQPLRAVATEHFAVMTKAGNTRGGTGELGRLLDRSRELFSGLIATPARTPGGIAWKLLEVLASIREDERIGDDWESWQYILTAACEDALNLERQRCQGGAS